MPVIIIFLGENMAAGGGGALGIETVYRFDPESVKEIVGDSKCVTVYGFGSCKYLQLTADLATDEHDTILKVYDCACGNIALRGDEREKIRKLDGTCFEQVEIELGAAAAGAAGGGGCDEDPLRDTRRVCKAGLTNIVIENAKRVLENKTLPDGKKLPMIPVLFAINITDNPFPAPSVELLATKKEDLNGLITHSELRRAYKLTLHSDPAVREAAIRTFRFIELEKLHDKAIMSEISWNKECEGKEYFFYDVKEIEAPWARAEEFLDNYKKIRGKDPHVASVSEKRFDWRVQVTKALDEYRRGLEMAGDHSGAVA